MFIAIVQIPMTKRPRQAAVDAAAKSAPTYSALGAKGLLKKYYLNGEAGGDTLVGTLEISSSGFGGRARMNVRLERQ